MLKTWKNPPFYIRWVQQRFYIRWVHTSFHKGSGFVPVVKPLQKAIKFPFLDYLFKKCAAFLQGSAAAEHPLVFLQDKPGK